MSVYYHVTDAAALPKILGNGIVPKIGPRSERADEQMPAIYLFNNKISVEDAVTNWLGEQFDLETTLYILEIELEPEQTVKSEAAYETLCLTPIPPAQIKRIRKV